ncbi:MAG: transposase [Bdellovibrionales bacterium]
MARINSSRNGGRRHRPRAGQLNLFPNTTQRFFGGRLLYGRRKGRRPLSSTEAVHVVFRSCWAVGENSFLRARNRDALRFIIQSVARNYGVKIYRLALASNHCHLIMKFRKRELYNNFIRVVTGRIASHVMNHISFADFVHAVLASGGTGPLETHGKGQRFFQFRPFSRLLYWGRDYKTCCDYVSQNQLEALGFIEYTTRRDSYARWYRETTGSSA